MTHAELVQRAGAWLRRTVNCAVVFEELHTSGSSEVPDAIGWRDSGRLSYLIECKASRGDFLADRAKPHRQPDAVALGCYRYFMCPAGMIREDELPRGWGLLYVHAKRVDIVRGRHPQRYDARQHSFYHKPSREGEMALLCSALHRLRLDLGDGAWHERVHRSYTERQAAPPRRFVFLDD